MDEHLFVTIIHMHVLKVENVHDVRRNNPYSNIKRTRSAITEILLKADLKPTQSLVT